MADDTEVMQTVGLAALIIGAICFFIVNLIVVANVIVDLRKETRPHTTMMMVLCVFNMPPSASLPAFPAAVLGFVGDRVFCTSIVFIHRAALQTSACLVTLMAGERWSALTQPFWYQRHVTPRRAAFVSMATVIGVVAICVFGVLPRSRFSSVIDVANSSEADFLCRALPASGNNNGFAFSLVFMCIIALNIYFNIATARTTTLMTRNMPDWSHQLRHEQAFLRLVRGLSAVFVLTCLPPCVVIFLRGMNVAVNSSLFSVCSYLFLCSYVTDPAVHLLMTPRYRSRIRSVLASAFGCFRRAPTEGNGARRMAPTREACVVRFVVDINLPAISKEVDEAMERQDVVEDAKVNTCTMP